MYNGTKQKVRRNEERRESLVHQCQGRAWQMCTSVLLAAVAADTGWRISSPARTTRSSFVGLNSWNRFDPYYYVIARSQADVPVIYNTPCIHEYRTRGYLPIEITQETICRATTRHVYYIYGKEMRSYIPTRPTCLVQLVWFRRLRITTTNSSNNQ